MESSFKFRVRYSVGSGVEVEDSVSVGLIDAKQLSQRQVSYIQPFGVYILIGAYEEGLVTH